MTDINSLISASDAEENQSYCTRQDDGVSGMTVTALADFCGTEQPTITQLLNRMRDSDPITNDLAACLKSFAGKDWRLITNNPDGSVFIIDDVCHAVLEYYALEARKYKGKQIAIDNYRMVAKGGLRVFIWSQTGYVPALTSQSVLSKEEISAVITNAIEQSLAPITQRLDAIEQRLKALPGANKPKRPWTLSASTPSEEVPDDYVQLEDGSWLSPEAYQSILRQSRRSLPWELRRLKNTD